MVDIVLLLESGFAGFVLGGIGVSIFYFVVLGRLKLMLYAWVDEYIHDFIEEIKANPKEFSQQMQPILSSLLGTMVGKPKGGGSPGFLKFLPASLRPFAEQMIINWVSKRVPGLGEATEAAVETMGKVE